MRVDDVAEDGVEDDAVDNPRDISGDDDDDGGVTDDDDCVRRNIDDAD